ncbi:MAG: A24 family peptidase [Candidatus Margulisiibacteriota bacterium]
MFKLTWIILTYFVIVLSYVLNVLITEMPLDHRYKKLKFLFSLKTLLSVFFRPLIYWFQADFESQPILIKLRHICVLFVTFILFLTYYMRFTVLIPVTHFIVFSILIICFFTDFEHQIIPNEMSFGLIFVGIAYGIFKNDFLDSFLGMMLVILVFSLFTIIIHLFGESHAFGAGDIKLCLGIGSVWGWQVTAIALYFTFLIGGIVGFYFLVIKKKSKHSYYAFAPVIIIGLLVALVYTDNIFDYYYPWINNSFQIESLHLKL